jgi:hypothetical protein
MFVKTAKGRKLLLRYFDQLPPQNYKQRELSLSSTRKG